MAKLTFKIHVRHTYPSGSNFSFWRDLVHLKAGTYSGGELYFYHSGWRGPQDYANERAQWQRVSLAIQGTKSLTFGMRPDQELERFFSRHTTLGEKLSNVEIQAYNDTHLKTDSWEHPRPDHSLGIFDVTVVPAIHTVENVTWVVLYYSGATKEWF